jgi:hypothetical protein
VHAVSSEFVFVFLGMFIYVRPFRRVRSSLEAGIDLILPNADRDYPFVQLLKREGEKTLLFDFGHPLMN